MPVKIRRGQIMVYRVLDVAEEIDLHLLEKVLKEEQNSRRLKLTKDVRRAVIIKNAPVRLNLGERELTVGGSKFRAETFGTVWDYGVISILFQIPILDDVDWSELVKIAEVLNEDPDLDSELERIAKAKVQEIEKLLPPRVASYRGHIVEDYVVFAFEEIEGIRAASDLIQLVDVPALLNGESKETLSPFSRTSILENVYQYSVNDLVVIDWNSAVVFDRPSALRDIVDILEFALTHLLEFRYYDDLLDSRLQELYQAIGLRRRSILQSSFTRIMRETNSRFIEFSEFIERVDNSLKVVGDFYLAGIFRGAVRRFRISDWQQSVTRKLNTLARVSGLLQGEVNAMRGHTLELIIILLIAFEIVSAIVKNT